MLPYFMTQNQDNYQVYFYIIIAKKVIKIMKKAVLLEMYEYTTFLCD